VKYRGVRLIPHFSHPDCSSDAFAEVYHGNAPAPTGTCYQYRRMGGSRYTSPGPLVRKGARTPDMLYMFFVFSGIIIICLLYKLTFSYKATVTLPLRVSLSHLV
jgi:hypothetical protein